MKKTSALKVLSKNLLSSLGFKHRKCLCFMDEKGNKTVVRKNEKLKTKEQREQKKLQDKKEKMYKIKSENDLENKAVNFFYLAFLANRM